ncbi:uncharacterized protein BJ171DRAFT_496980 [Polychytrium aggregatum]|uniref:uncharacterized protein n=1 Tax=Polychytrium aggregatum TaxID=110093 RepID=UPI0022FECA85|nr:uncharacterized protein BJ171DRAFT_496980 [Polychytrium aggregatum]KAI9206795.1 hypothetical protein BJ171DRAFT_496980 [Polychytrium aggregatum]
MSAEELHSHWQFAAISQFLHLFYPALQLDSFSTPDLENSLLNIQTTSNLLALTPDASNPTYYLKDIMCRLLKLLTSNKPVTPDNWQTHLATLFQSRADRLESALLVDPHTDYFDLPLKNKLLVLYYLCEWQLDFPEQFRSLVEESDEDETTWRVDPLGYDHAGNTYWLFDDNRLFKESPAPSSTASKSAAKARKGRNTRNSRSVEDEQQALQESSKVDQTPSNWSLVCGTSVEWTEFPKQFENSRYTVEKELYAVLVESVLPQVVEEMMEEEKKILLQEALLNRKRSSRLQDRELERMAIDARKKEEEAVLTARLKEEERQRQELLARQQQLKAREERLLRREKKLESLRIEREKKLLKKQAGTETGAVEVAVVSEPPESEIAVQIDAQRRQSSRRRSQRPDPEVFDETLTEDAWYFDCVCGVYGERLDDGKTMIECERCHVWQHLDCQIAHQGGNPDDEDDMKRWEAAQFICETCIAKEERENERLRQEAEAQRIAAEKQRREEAKRLKEEELRRKRAAKYQARKRRLQEAKAAAVAAASSLSASVTGSVASVGPSGSTTPYPGESGASSEAEPDSIVDIIRVDANDEPTAMVRSGPEQPHPEVHANGSTSLLSVSSALLGIASAALSGSLAAGASVAAAGFDASIPPEPQISANPSKVKSLGPDGNPSSMETDSGKPPKKKRPYTPKKKPAVPVEAGAAVAADGQETGAMQPQGPEAQPKPKPKKSYKKKEKPAVVMAVNGQPAPPTPAAAPLPGADPAQSGSTASGSLASLSQPTQPGSLDSVSTQTGAIPVNGATASVSAELKSAKPLKGADASKPAPAKRQKKPDDPSVPKPPKKAKVSSAQSQPTGPAAAYAPPPPSSNGASASGTDGPSLPPNTSASRSTTPPNQAGPFAFVPGYRPYPAPQSMAMPKPMPHSQGPYYPPAPAPVPVQPPTRPYSSAPMHPSIYGSMAYGGDPAYTGGTWNPHIARPANGPPPSSVFRPSQNTGREHSLARLIQPHAASSKDAYVPASRPPPPPPSFRPPPSLAPIHVHPAGSYPPSAGMGPGGHSAHSSVPSPSMPSTLPGMWAPVRAISPQSEAAAAAAAARAGGPRPPNYPPSMGRTPALSSSTPANTQHSGPPGGASASSGPTATAYSGPK